MLFPELLPVETLLIRASEQRILLLEQAIEQYAPRDPERHRLQSCLVEEQNRLIERLRFYARAARYDHCTYLR